MDKSLVTSILLENGLLKSSRVKFRSLQGGVSSDIVHLTDGKNHYVVKQALPKLQVEDDWYADPSRNQTEQKFAGFISRYVPEAVPEILYRDDENGFFVMEYLNSTFQNWKEQLLKGNFESETSEKAAKLLSTIHRASWKNSDAEQTFDTTPNFISLRIEPYLITTGNRHPDLKALFQDEAKKLEQRRIALVHGDFSPKNIMVRPDRLVLLDHEVAWFGDPAFDMAFFLNHLYLKKLYHTRSTAIPTPMPDLARIAWETYSESLGKEKAGELENRIGRLLLMLMLARVDGKSPVEYLDEPQKQVIRSFVREMLPHEIFNQNEIRSNWQSILESYAR